VKNFLEDFEELYRKEYPKTPVLGLPSLWRTFMRDLTEKQKDWVKVWLKYRTKRMVKVWEAEAERRLAAVGTTRSPQAAGKAMAYQREAALIFEKAEQHKTSYAVAANKFDPKIVFQ
jgi:hypothetical protein